MFVGLLFPGICEALFFTLLQLALGHETPLALYEKYWGGGLILLESILNIHFC